VRALDAAEKTAAFRKELDALVDRWNDSAAGDRLAQAVALCESWLSKSKGDDKAGDLDIRLELTRLRLAKGDNQAAEKDANAAEKAAVAANSDLKTTAKALYLIAFERSANERLTKLSGDEQKKGVEEFQKAHKDLIDNFIQAAGGTKEAAGKLYMEQSERIATAASLNELGKEPKAIGKPDLDGKVVNLADYKGKVVLVDFWATWCGPCMHEMPNVVKTYAEFHPRGLEIVGVSLDKDRAALDKVLKDAGMTWRQVFDGKGWESAVAVAWEVHSIPHTCLIDHTGKVRYLDARGEGLAAAVKQLVERAEKSKGSDAEQPKKGD
jgi:thiol-disulfide isomerase/thioredoxin